ncbi:MAG: DUF192 domain-containing protein [Selenomonadaceae bacterium]|nr:DUF192 domain-containing protein [Selenomonadaceae bacterium]
MEKFFINDKTIEVETADNFFKRLRGLMFRKNLDEGRGLLIAPCNSVHMMFMRFAIDVVYLDKSLCIKKIVRDLTPWLGMSICFGAWAALELPRGSADKFNLSVGQKFSRK